MKLYAAAMRQARKAFLKQALHVHGWNVAATARAIGLDRSTLYDHMRELGLKGRRR